MTVIKSKFVGKVFGNLKVLEIDESKDRTYYICECVCGNKISIRGESIRTKDNCGCIREQEVIDIVNNLNLTLLNTYFKGKRRRVIVQDENGYKADIKLIKLIYHNGNFHFTDSSNPYSLENISLWLYKNKKSFILCENNIYLGSPNKLRFHCFDCNDEFSSTWGSVSQGQNCAICDGAQAGKYNNLAYLRPDIAKEYSTNNVLSANQVTVSSGKYVEWVCSICDHVWNISISDRTRKDHPKGCPKCASSKGEKEISRILNLYSIEFTPQYKFKDCRCKNPLPFDFYLPDFGIIEFHGPQHYFPVDFAGRGIAWAEDQFRQNQIKDKIKEDYCYKNNINLLIIPYTEFSNIEQILTDYLQL